MQEPEQNPVEEASRKGTLKRLAIYAIGATCFLFLGSALFRVFLFLVEHGKAEYLLHPAAIGVGTLIVYRLAMEVLGKLERWQMDLERRLDRIESLIMDHKLEELRKIKEGKTQ